MNDQLDKLESSVARLVQAYNEMKAENAALKAQLADKTAAVRGRIESLIVSLTADQQTEQPSA